MTGRFYHGTTRSNLLNILSKGLKPMSGSSTNIREDGVRIKGVCLCKYKKDAHTWACRKAWNNSTNDPIILTVKDIQEYKLKIAREKKKGKISQFCKVSFENIDASKIVKFEDVKMMSEYEINKNIGG